MPTPLLVRAAVLYSPALAIPTLRCCAHCTQSESAAQLASRQRRWRHGGLTQRVNLLTTIEDIHRRHGAHSPPHQDTAAAAAAAAAAEEEEEEEEEEEAAAAVGTETAAAALPDELAEFAQGLQAPLPGSSLQVQYSTVQYSTVGAALRLLPAPPFVALLACSKGGTVSHSISVLGGIRSAHSRLG